MKIVLSFLIFFLVFSNCSFANEELNATQIQQKESFILEAHKTIQEIEVEISDANIWIKSYASYLTSIEVKENLKKIKKRIRYLTRHARRMEQRDELNGLIAKENILQAQLGKLKGNTDSPFANLITPPKIDDVPKISNPFDILTGLSLIKTLNSNFDEYKKRKDNLSSLIVLLRKESEIYKKLTKLDKKK